jgi:hypothetical protein
MSFNPSTSPHPHYIPQQTTPPFPNISTSFLHQFLKQSFNFSSLLTFLLHQKLLILSSDFHAILLPVPKTSINHLPPLSFKSLFLTFFVLSRIKEAVKQRHDDLPLKIELELRVIRVIAKPETFSKPCFPQHRKSSIRNAMFVLFTTPQPEKKLCRKQFSLDECRFVIVLNLHIVGSPARHIDQYLLGSEECFWGNANENKEIFHYAKGISIKASVSCGNNRNFHKSIFFVHIQRFADVSEWKTNLEMRRRSRLHCGRRKELHDLCICSRSFRLRLCFTTQQLESLRHTLACTFHGFYRSCVRISLSITSNVACHDV